MTTKTQDVAAVQCDSRPFMKEMAELSEKQFTHGSEGKGRHLPRPQFPQQEKCCNKLLERFAAGFQLDQDDEGNSQREFGEIRFVFDGWYMF